MHDDVLTGIDDAMARAASRPRTSRRRPRPASPPRVAAQEPPPTPMRPGVLERPFWVWLFLAIQFLWGIPLFLPGAQSIRFFVRALPYASTLLFLVVFEVSRPRTAPLPRGAGWLIAALLLLVLNLLHPTSQISAGVAQCVFQLSIAAPVFWLHKAVRSSRQMTTLLVLILVFNFLSAALGVLQVYYPDRFMPPQFSLQLNEDSIGALSYVGANGRLITRPPGLSDTPGGAAIAGGLTALIGLGLLLHLRRPLHILLVAGMVAVGLSAVYLTQVRSVLLVTIGAASLIGLTSLRHQKLARAGWAFAVGSALVVVSFLWAASIGGDAVESRFLNIGTQGAISTYQQNRGTFLSYTVGELLDQFPFGAGVGRWGMMQAYFGAPTPDSPPIHVEIQLTGWLLDGGIPMWIAYGAALLFSCVSVGRVAFMRGLGVAEHATLVLGIQGFIVAMSLAGPAFNMQLGILFWTAAAALHGAATAPDDRDGQFVEPLAA